MNDSGFDPVEKPKHYNSYPLEVIDIVERVLTKEQFQGYLFGNILKYRMRAGLKDDPVQDIAKAEWYRRRLNDETPGLFD